MINKLKEAFLASEKKRKEREEGRNVME